MCVKQWDAGFFVEDRFFIEDRGVKFPCVELSVDTVQWGHKLA